MALFSSLMLMALGLLSYYGIKEVMKGTQEVYRGGMEEMNSLQEMNQIIYQDILGALRDMRYRNISVAEGKSSIEQAFNDLIKRYSHYNEDLEANFESLSREVGASIMRDQAEINNTLRSISEEANADEIAHKQRHLFSLINQTAEKIKNLAALHYEATKRDLNEAISTGNTTLGRIAIAVCLGIFLCVLLKTIIIRSVIKPLFEAVKAVDRLSTGDTSQDVIVDGQNEVEQVMRSVQKMSDTTKQMGSALASIASGNLLINAPIRSDQDTLGKAMDHMIHSLKKMLGQIQAEVNSLTSSTQEIVASINQVSTGTSETAAAVNETTSTMEELKQTAHISADKASDVLSNVADTQNVVKKGEKTLHLTMNEMNQIQEKMRIISQSIVKLSEHSTAIGEIINTVNNLAEQSNLLAVNAAIEAAKAGDQGKSFGVVAQEIRTLAEQSKAATIQIRAILNDIQNATSSAILATEQGSKAVLKGVEQSSEMAETIHALSNSIAHVSMAANQIAISSKQQLVGVDQVTEAMNNINDATSQHVEHMRQIETAVHNLNDVAIVLKELVSAYKVEDSGRLLHDMFSKAHS